MNVHECISNIDTSISDIVKYYSELLECKISGNDILPISTNRNYHSYAEWLNAKHKWGIRK